MKKVDFYEVPHGGILADVGGYDLTRRGRSLCVWPCAGAQKDNLEIIFPRLPEAVYLVLAPTGDDEHPVYVCYSEAEALKLAASHNPGCRVRSIHAWDAERVEQGTATAGPVPVAVA